MMISVCADKAAAGATTVALALAAVWPGRRVLLEADPSGASLPFRALMPDGSALAAEPNVAALAAASRSGRVGVDVGDFAQVIACGAPVIPGALSADLFTPLRQILPGMASVCRAWPGVVIADLGRVSPLSLPVMSASTAVLLLAGSGLEGMWRLRDRLPGLLQMCGPVQAARHPVCVVVCGPAAVRAEAVRSAGQVLASAGWPLDVAGFVPDDDRDVARRLMSGGLTRKDWRSPLMRAASDLSQTLTTWWPELVADGQESAA